MHFYQYHLDAGHSTSLQRMIHHHKYFAYFIQRFGFIYHKIFDALNKDLKNLIYSKKIVDFGLALGSSFLSIFLWRKTASIELVVSYHLIQFPAILFAYTIAAFFIKVKIRSLLQIGILLHALTFFLLLFFNDINFNLIFILGLLTGTAIGFYWTGFHSLSYIKTKDYARDLFFSLDSALGNFTSIFVPFVTSIILATQFVGGGPVPLQNYYYLFICTIAILIAGFIYVFKLPDIQMPQIGMNEVKKVLKNKVWTVIGLREFIDGFKGGSEVFLGALLMFFIFNNEFDMSVFNTVIALLSVLISLKMGLLLTRKNRLFYGGLGSLLLVISRIIFIGFFSVTGFIAYSLINLIANPFFGLGMVSTFFDAIDHSHKTKNDYLLYIYFREIPLTLGRTAGAFLFILFLQLGQELTLAKTWFLIVGFIPLIYFLLTKSFEHKFEK